MIAAWMVFTIAVTLLLLVAVLGVLRSRIVLPEWVLTLPGRERDAILAHEREHAAAYDPALICAAMVLLALQPWNIALWGVMGRLRMAMESDCDRRVLDAMGDGGARWYARLLILVYERSTLNPALGIGFVTRPSNLERRIRRIVIQPRVTAMAGVKSLLGALLVVTACRASAPVRRDRQSLVPDSNVPVLPSERPAPSGTVAGQLRLTSPTRHAAHPPDARCSLAARRTEPEHTVLWPGRWPVNAGCSVYGDIIVVYVDSTNLLVAARDTADVGITAFFVFQTEPGASTPDLAWSTTTGRAELTDTTMSFSSPAPGAKPVVVRLRRKEPPDVPMSSS